MSRIKKRNSPCGGKTNSEDNGEESFANGRRENVTLRRGLRSRYLAVKSLISDERDGIARADSDKFKSIFNEVESLHQMVSKPREQVADAEALMEILSTVVISVKAHGNEGVTPADFINGLLGASGQQVGASWGAKCTVNSVKWKHVGLAVSHIFKRVSGCCTMVGPMSTEIKQRRTTGSRRKRVRPTESSKPEELDHSTTEGSTDTDKNMATMFDILKKNRRVKLENLVLNRKSFAETVENVFALSFLIKDGRAEITVDEKGCHIVSPRNGPSADAVVSGEVAYNHYVSRFDFKDWKLMTASVAMGEELMPPRKQSSPAVVAVGEELMPPRKQSSPAVVAVGEELMPPRKQSSPAVVAVGEEPMSPRKQSSHAVVAVGSPAVYIRKISRNRAVLHGQTIKEDSPECDDSAATLVAIQTGKRKLSDEMELQ